MGNAKTFAEFTNSFEPTTFQLVEKDEDTLLVLLSNPTNPGYFTLGEYTILDDKFTIFDIHDIISPLLL